MTVAQSHYYSPSDRLSSSSSPDNHAASRFTPDDSSSNNDDDYRGGEGMGISTTNLQMTSDNIEAYELRDIVVGRSTTKDFSDDEEDDDDDNDKSSEEFEIGGDLENDQNLVYTAEEERTVVRKFDRRLVLFVALLYMLSFLDRSSASQFFLLVFLSNLHIWILHCLLSCSLVEILCGHHEQEGRHYRNSMITIQNARAV